MKYKLVFFIVLVLLGLIIWKTYWRLQLMYNTTILSLFTPDTFPINNPSEYHRIVNLGDRSRKGKRIVIASLLRDAEERIPNIRKRVEATGNLFGDYHVLIVENDSKDRTRELLLQWSVENPRITILGCGYNVSECHLKSTPKTIGHHVDRSRIEKMTMLRNIYLKEIHLRFTHYDYVLVWDLDLLGSVYLDGIVHSIGVLASQPDISAVCSYGIYRWGYLTLFYDTYALLYQNEEFHIDMKTVHDLRKGLFETFHQRGDPLLEVDSCFSGFTIYRAESLLDIEYDLSPANNLECEHVRLNKKIQGKKVINPSMINLVLLND